MAYYIYYAKHKLKGGNLVRSPIGIPLMFGAMSGVIIAPPSLTGFSSGVLLEITCR